MFVELSDGTEVQIVNSGRGLEGAAYRYAGGPPEEHLHVHLRMAGGFACSHRGLTRAEIEEAEQLYAEAVEAKADEENALREKLIGPDGDALLAEKMRGRNPKETATSDVSRALGLSVYTKQNPTWAEVQVAIQALRTGRTDVVEAMIALRKQPHGEKKRFGIEVPVAL